MALDWSIGLHAICVRVELDKKIAAPKKGYLLEFTAFMVIDGCILCRYALKGAVTPRGSGPLFN